MPALILSGCSKDDKPSKPAEGKIAQIFDIFFSQKLAAKTLKIISLDGKALAGAQVLIGDKLGSPFDGNFLTANQYGNVVLPEEWTQPETLTINADGYLRATYLMQAPGDIEIKLRPTPSNELYEVGGMTPGSTVVDGDGFIDFGLVVPALTKTDLLAFNMENFISPEMDVITALGKDLLIPSNVTFAKQTERYFLVPITLEKPPYRVYFNQLGVTRLFAARGRFPFKTVLDELRNKTKFPELINEFDILGGGIRDIEILGLKNKLNIPLRDFSFTGKRIVTAPVIADDELFITVGVTEQSGYMIPTDIKRISSGKSLNISILPNAPAQIVGIVKKESEMSGKNPGADRLSATILPFTPGVSPTMLPLLPNPSINGTSILEIPAIQTIAGVNQIATYSLLSRVEKLTNNGRTSTILNRYWEIYAAGWMDRVEIPEWPNDSAIVSPKRWEVTLVGSQTSSLTTLGPSMIERATHVTHSSLDF